MGEEICCVRRRSVAIPTNCRLRFNHWEIHPVRVLGLHKPTLKDAAQSRRIKLGIFLAVLFSPATAAPSPRFSASSAPLSADAYSSTRPVCIYTGNVYVLRISNSNPPHRRKKTRRGQESVATSFAVCRMDSAFDADAALGRR